MIAMPAMGGNGTEPPERPCFPTIVPMSLIPDDRLHVLDRRAMRELDRRAIEEVGVPGIVLMENAARGAADVAMDMAGGRSTVGICCGPGNNGGDGWAIARHLANQGRRVLISTFGSPQAGTDAAVNAEICRHMKLPSEPWQGMLECDLIVDALFGTGLDRPIEGTSAEAITWINEQTTPVLAVDLPSGLDADTGAPLGIAVRATCTATFAAWKLGFTTMESIRWTGDIHTVDIGAPCTLAAELGTPLAPDIRHGKRH